MVLEWHSRSYSGIYPVEERMPTHNLELERLFKKLCTKNPREVTFEKFKSFPDHDMAVDFLVDKIHHFLAIIYGDDKHHDSNYEWGVTHACHLLGEFNDPKAAIPLVEVLDLVVDHYDSWLHNAAIIALQDMGAAAFDIAYQKYQRDRHDRERDSIWLFVLSDLGVKNDRIKNALLEHMRDDSAEAVNLMGHYGDKSLLPIAEQFVRATADFLNQNQIDPFAPGIRFEEPAVEAYINCRESLVILRDGIRPSDPEFDSRVEALDRELLQHADFTDYGKPRVGRNDPCPCGSGKKFKKCCGKS